MQPASANTALIEDPNAVATSAAKIHDGADQGSACSPVPQGSMGAALSAAVDRNGQRFAYLGHAGIAQPTDPIRQQSNRDALDRVKIDCSSATDRIVIGFEDHLTREVADRRGARSDQRSAKSANRRIPRQHDDRSPADGGRFAPPEFAPKRGGHDDATAVRND